MQLLRNTLLLLLLCAAAASAQVYKWVDEDGIVHYTDQPVPGAERIDIESRPTSRSAPRPRATTRRQDDAATEAPAQPFRYESISFASPTSEESLWNIGGILNVQLSLSPGLRSGDRVRIYFDGEPRMITGTGVVLEEVWRGTHNLQAEVLDASGALLIRSRPIQFHVHQTSVLN